MARNLRAGSNVSTESGSRFGTVVRAYDDRQRGSVAVVRWLDGSEEIVPQFELDREKSGTSEKMNRVANHLRGAKIVKKDPKRNLTLAWFGGHGVHVYDPKGEEVAFWSVGDFARDSAGPSEIEKSMNEAIRDGKDY